MKMNGRNFNSIVRNTVDRSTRENYVPFVFFFFSIVPQMKFYVQGIGKSYKLIDKKEIDIINFRLERLLIIRITNHLVNFNTFH